MIIYLHGPGDQKKYVTKMLLFHIKNWRIKKMVQQQGVRDDSPHDSWRKLTQMFKRITQEYVSGLSRHTQNVGLRYCEIRKGSCNHF